MLFHNVGVKLEKLYEITAVYSRCASSSWIISHCMSRGDGDEEKEEESSKDQEGLAETSMEALWSALHGVSGDAASARMLQLLKRRYEGGGGSLQGVAFTGGGGCIGILGSSATLSALKDTEGGLVVEQQRMEDDVMSAMQPIQKFDDRWGTCLETELSRIEGDEGESHVLLSRQIPLARHFASLWRMLNNRTHLTIIDFSCCFLGDDRVSALLGLLANEPQLRVLMLDFNEITVRLKPLFASLLHPENTQCHAVAKFPFLQWLSLAGNPITTQLKELQAIWETRLSFMPHSLLPLSKSKGRRNVKTLRVAVLGGAGMEAYLLALALRNYTSSGSSVSYEDIWSRTDVFCAASFATIVAAAMALRIPADRMAACFISIAENVFTVSAISVPFRVMHAHWGGGNYYHVPPFALALRGLFGEASDMTLADIEAATGKHLLFYAALHTNGGGGLLKAGAATRDGMSSSDKHDDGGGNNGGVDLFTRRCVTIRSWSSATPNDVNDEAWRRSTLLEVLLACCCTPEMVGPVRVSRGVALRDALVVPVPQLVCECLENTPITCGVHLEFWSPREGVSDDGVAFPVGLLHNPLLLQELVNSRDDALPSASLLRLKRWQGIEWVAALVDRGGLASLSQKHRLSCSLITLLKLTRRDELRYDESSMSLLTNTLPEAVSTHALGVVGAVVSLTALS